MKRMIIFGMLCWFVTGCFSSSLDLTIKFDRVEGLKAGDRVLFQENQAGEVEKITYTDEGAYLVQIAIDGNFKAAATEHTRFFIIGDPKVDGHKAIKLVQVRTDGKALADGSTVTGSTPTSAIFEAVMQQVNQGMDDFNAYIAQLSKEINDIPESDAYKDLESKLNQLMGKMESSSEEMRRAIKEEILPQIEAAIERLKEQLKDQGREEEVAPLESKIEDIKTM